MTKEVINDIYMLCRTQLAWVVSRIVPPHEIEDIVQETYVRVCQYKTQAEIREPRALMVKIARNLALDHVKRAEVRLAAYYRLVRSLSEGGRGGIVRRVCLQNTGAVNQRDHRISAHPCQKPGLSVALRNLKVRCYYFDKNFFTNKAFTTNEW